MEQKAPAPTDITPPPSPLKRTWPWLLLAAIGFYLLRGVIDIFLMESWLDEGIYVAKGYYAVSGYIPWYGSGVWMEYMPFYFLITGWLQRLSGGPSFIVCRCFSLFVGLGVVLLTYWLALKLESRFAANLAVWLTVTNFIAMQYYATATPPVIVVFLFLLVLCLLLSRLSPPAMIVLSIITSWLTVFARQNFFPAYFIIVLFLLYRFRRKQELALTLIVAIVIPVLSFLPFMPGMAALLYGLPGLSIIAAALHTPPPLPTGLYSFPFHWKEFGAFIALFLRLNTIFYLCSAVIAAALLFASKRRRQVVGEKISHREILVLTGVLFFVNLILHFWAAKQFGCAKCIIQYHNYFFPLGAVLAGVLGGALYRSLTGKNSRRIWLGLAVLPFIISPAFEKTWLLKNPQTGVQMVKMKKTAAALRQKTRPQDKFFLLGEVHSLFLADRRPYPQQLNTHFSYVLSQNTQQVAAQGFVNEAMMQKWLAEDADWVALNPYVEQRMRMHGPEWRHMMDAVDALLAAHFTLDTTYKDWNGDLLLYRRVARTQSP